jgi:hypothetical protein
MATEKEDLDQFIHSQGWLRFRQYAEREWNEQFQRHVRIAISDREELAALRKLQQVTVAKEAVDALLKWPTERLAQLEAAEASRKTAEHVPLSRRGTL